jgi:hypothetical protein
MTTLIAAMQNSVLVLESSKTGWKTLEDLKGTHPQIIAFDRKNPTRTYCGTFGDGLWKTDDSGQKCDNIGKNQTSLTSNITSVSVSSLKEEHNEFSKVYVGTEPSALYTSSDEGKSWEKMDGLSKLESSKSWSFPPRPWTIATLTFSLI